MSLVKVTLCGSEGNSEPEPDPVTIETRKCSKLPLVMLMSLLYHSYNGRILDTFDWKKQYKDKRFYYEIRLHWRTPAPVASLWMRLRLWWFRLTSN